MQQGLLLLQALTLVSREGKGLQQAESKIRHYWSLMYRIGIGDVTAKDEFESEGKITSEQQKLLDLFEELQASGALEPTEEELAMLEEMN